MDIPILYAATPIQISATYDKIWVDEIVISAPEVGGAATARVRLRHFSSGEDGVNVAPDGGVWLQVEDILTAAEQDQDLAVAVGALMAYVAKLGIERGVIS
jgi:hypothetical protein